MQIETESESVWKKMSSVCGNRDERCVGSLIVNEENLSHSPDGMNLHNKRNQPKLPYIAKYDENNLLDYPIIEYFK